MLSQEWKEQARHGQDALEIVGRCLMEARREDKGSSSSTIREAAKTLATPRLQAYVLSTSKPEQALPTKLSDAIQKLNGRTKKLRKLHEQLSLHLAEVSALIERTGAGEVNEEMSDVAGIDGAAHQGDPDSGAGTCMQQWALLLGTIAGGVGQECAMFDVITAHVDHRTSSDQFEAFQTFWALHPYIEDGVVDSLCRAFSE